jgi:hypothetical protein
MFEFELGPPGWTELCSSSSSVPPGWTELCSSSSSVPPGWTEQSSSSSSVPPGWTEQSSSLNERQRKKPGRRSLGGEPALLVLPAPYSLFCTSLHASKRLKMEPSSPMEDTTTNTTSSIDPSLEQSTGLATASSPSAASGPDLSPPARVPMSKLLDGKSDPQKQLDQRRKTVANELMKHVGEKQKSVAKKDEKPSYAMAFKLETQTDRCTLCKYADHPKTVGVCSLTREQILQRCPAMGEFINHSWVPCGRKVLCCSKSTNTSLKRHLESAKYHKDAVDFERAEEMLSRSSKRARKCNEQESSSSVGTSGHPLGKTFQKAGFTRSSKVRFNESVALWCVMDSRPFFAIQSPHFHRMIASANPNLSPGMSRKTFNGIVREIFAKTKENVASCLRKVQSDFHGLPSGYIQTDMTSHRDTEYITTSITVITQDFSRKTINLGVEWFNKGKATGESIAQFLRKQMDNILSNDDTEIQVLPDVQVIDSGDDGDNYNDSDSDCSDVRELRELLKTPSDAVQLKDIVFCGSVDQGTNVQLAMKILDIPVELCSAHRCNTCVKWALGLAGSKNTCLNPEMKELIAKAAAIVCAFSHNCASSDKLKQIQANVNDAVKKKYIAQVNEQLELARAEINDRTNIAVDEVHNGGDADEVDDDCAADDLLDCILDSISGDLTRQNMTEVLAVVKRQETRWSSTLTMLKRLLELKTPIQVFYLFEQTMLVNAPGSRNKRAAAKDDRCLTESEWTTIHQLVQLLEPVATIVRALQGGDGAFSSVIMAEVNTLISFLESEDCNIKDEDGEVRPWLVVSPAVKKVREILLDQLKRRFGADEAKEVGNFQLLSKFVHPYTALMGLTLEEVDDVKYHLEEEHRRITARERAHLRAQQRMASKAKEGAQGVTALNKEVISDQSAYGVFRKRHKKNDKMAALAAFGVSDDDAETPAWAEEYKKYVRLLKKTTKTDSSAEEDPLEWWKRCTEPVSDGITSEVTQPFPFMALMARRYLAMLGSSCQAERDFSEVSNILTAKRSRIHPEVVRMMMFIKMNYEFVPEQYKKN